MSNFNISKDRAEKLKMFEDNVKKSMGKGHLSSAESLKMNTRISSGSLKIDRITGGGWKIGRQHGIWGPKGSGKTTICIQAIKWAQRMCNECYEYIVPQLLVPPTGEDSDVEDWMSKRMHCMNCGAPHHLDDRPPLGSNNDTCKECGEPTVVELDEDDSYQRIEGDEQCGCDDNACSRFFTLYVDLEGKLDMEWVEKLGVNLQGVRVERPDYGAQAGDLILDVTEKGLFDLIITDSIATYVSTERMEKSVEDDVIGSRAQQVGQILQQFPSMVNQAFREHGVIPTMFVINQVRESIGGYGDNRVKPGGKAQEFMPSTWINTKKAYGENHLIKDSPGKSGNTKSGTPGGAGVVQTATKVHFRMKCEKNSTGPTQGLEAGPVMLVIDWRNRKAGDWTDHRLVYEHGRKAGVIYKQDREYHVKDWPLAYSTAGDLKIDMRHRWYLKHHIKKLVLDRNLNDYYNLALENDWIKDDEDI